MRTMISDSGELFAVCQVTGFTQECPWRCSCAYAEGKLSPNYPVPAIIYDVILWDNQGNGTNLAVETMRPCRKTQAIEIYTPYQRDDTNPDNEIVATWART